MCWLSSQYTMLSLFCFHLNLVNQHICVSILTWLTVTSVFQPKYSKLALVSHIVPCGKFHRIGGAPPETFSSEKYDAPEEVGGDRKCFDSPIRK